MPKLAWLARCYCTCAADARVLRMRGQCGSNIWTAVVIVENILTCLIFSDQIFRKEKGERFLLMISCVVTFFSKINLTIIMWSTKEWTKNCSIDEKSDETSFAVACGKCEKRFFNEKKFIRHYVPYHELDIAWNVINVFLTRKVTKQQVLYHTDKKW